MTNLFSRFVPHYATITEPLRQLTHKDCKWKWSREHDKAFDQLREALSKAPTLAYFDETKDTSIYVDASPVGIAAILTQKSRNGKHTHTISYASRALTSVEQRYSQTEREALAVVWACEHFHIHIYGKPVTVYTDHKPLISLYGNPNSKPPARIERWSLRLQPYSANIVYIVGSNNPATIFYNRPLNIKLPHLTEQSQDEVLRNRDANRKADMKEYADRKGYVKRSDLQEGDLVLVRNAPTLRKSSAPFEKDPYRIVNKNNSMITAESASGRKVTRNSSFFKKLDPKTIINEETRVSDDQDQDDDIDVPPDDPPNIIIPPDIVIPPNIVVPPNNVADAVEQVAPPATRERRQVRKPAWLKDFVMD